MLNSEFLIRNSIYKALMCVYLELLRTYFIDSNLRLIQKSTVITLYTLFNAFLTTKIKENRNQILWKHKIKKSICYQYDHSQNS